MYQIQIQNCKLLAIKLFVEMLGTIILTYSMIVASSRDSNKSLVPFYGLIVLWLLVGIFGGVSYGHFNPTVSMSWSLRAQKGKFVPCPMLPLYLISQFLGGFLGSLLVWFIKNQTNGAIIQNSQLTDAFVTEVGASYLLVQGILISSQKLTQLSQTPAVNSLIIGVSHALAINFALDVVSGINPAIGFGANLVSYIQTGNSDFLNNIWVFLVFTPLGGLLAVLIHEKVIKTGIKLNSQDFQFDSIQRNSKEKKIMKVSVAKVNTQRQGSQDKLKIHIMNNNNLKNQPQIPLSEEGRLNFEDNTRVIESSRFSTIQKVGNGHENGDDRKEVKEF